MKSNNMNERKYFAGGIDNLSEHLEESGYDAELTGYDEEQRQVIGRMLEYMGKELTGEESINIEDPDENSELALYKSFNQLYLENTISEDEFIELAGDVQALESEILYDRLTGLANRRSFIMEAERQTKICKRQEATYSMAVLDIDHFGRLNDTLSHKHGDAVLIALARLFKKVLPRKSDLPCRYGGEEFVIILAGTSKDGAELVGERIRQTIANELLAEANMVIDEFNAELEPDNQISKISTDDIPRITISVGVAEFEQGKDYKTVFIRADQALVQAKTTRNTVTSWNTELGDKHDAEVDRELEQATQHFLEDISLTTLSRDEIIAKFERDIEDSSSEDALASLIEIKKLLLEKRDQINEKTWQIIYTNLEKMMANYTVDQLTGLSNRAEYERRLSRELATAERYGQPISMLVMDLDLFSSINDIYGHEVGDAVLHALGSTLKKAVREIDVVCRMGAGSEEFSIIMPNTDEDNAVAIAERVRQFIASNLILEYNAIRESHGLSDKAYDLQADRNLTVTIGVSTIEPSTQQITRNGQECTIHRFAAGANTTIFMNADNAMVKAKEIGTGQEHSKQILKDPNVPIEQKKEMVRDLLSKSRNCVGVLDSKTGQFRVLERQEAVG
jgi:diguanylate cyclase (GGDEF)-like protein